MVRVNCKNHESLFASGDHPLNCIKRLVIVFLCPLRTAIVHNKDSQNKFPRRTAALFSSLRSISAARKNRYWRKLLFVEKDNRYSIRINRLFVMVHFWFAHQFANSGKYETKAA